MQGDQLTAAIVRPSGSEIAVMNTFSRVQFPSYNQWKTNERWCIDHTNPVEVFGSEGVVAVENNKPDTHVYLNKEGAHSALPLNFFMDRYTESYLKEMEAFIDCIRNDQPPSISGKDGLLSLIIGMAAKQSCLENRTVRLTEIYDFKN